MIVGFGQAPSVTPLTTAAATALANCAWYQSVAPVWLSAATSPSTDSNALSGPACQTNTTLVYGGLAAAALLLYLLMGSK